MTEKKVTVISIIMSVVASVLVAAIVIGAIFVGVGVFTRKRGSISYNDIEYSRPDFDDIDRAFEDATYKAGHGSSSSAVAAMNEATSLLNELVAYLGYANIEYQKDYTNERWSDEYAALYEQYSKSYLDYCTMMYTALHGPNSSSIFRGWSQAELDAIDAEYAALTGSGNYVEGQREILELQNQYNNLGSDDGTSVYKTEESARKYATQAGGLLIEMAKTYNEMYPDGSYPDYAYASYGRTYTPEDAEKMRSYVREYLGEYVVRLYDEMGDDGIKASGTQFVMISDGRAVVDTVSSDEFFASAQNAALGMFGVIESSEAVSGVSSSMRGYLTDAFEYMYDYDLYYTSRNGNGNTGAFTTYLSGFEIPYLFQYRNDAIDDISTFVHEFGHFSSYYLSGAYGGSDLDVAEIQSQGLEMMLMNYYDEVYGSLTVTSGGTTYSGETLADLMRKSELFSQLLFSVVMGCIMDELQYDVYTNIGNYDSGADVTAKYTSLLREYGLTESFTRDYSELIGYDYDYFEYWWAAVSHTFSQPFYYISYAMSAVPAFSVYVDSTSDFVAAAREYNFIQYYGNGESGYTLETLLAEAGTGSPFEESTYEEIGAYLETVV